MAEKKEILQDDLFSTIEISVEEQNQIQLFHQRVIRTYILMNLNFLLDIK